jgi:YaiO family outer membrane protein
MWPGRCFRAHGGSPWRPRGSAVLLIAAGLTQGALLGPGSAAAQEPPRTVEIEPLLIEADPRPLLPAVAAPVPSKTAHAGRPQPLDALAEARKLVARGQRAQALQVLDRRLAETPRDDDARLYRGIILGGDRRYVEAREELSAVLQRNARYTDAREASINIELWSGNLERAEVLASEGLALRAEHPAFLLGRASARLQLGRLAEAREDLVRLLAVAPEHERARRLLAAVEDGLRVWDAGLQFAYSAFREDRSPWTEIGAHVGRRGQLVTASLHAQRAERFDQTSSQLELELYPKFRRGTYGYLGLAYSPQVRFYPEYRAAADLYQAIGWGFEVFAGYRRAAFSVPVNGGQLGLAKYWGNWVWTLRAGVSSGRSRSGSVGLHARRYLWDSEAFVGLRYGRGAAVEVRNANDSEIVDSDSGSIEVQVPIGRWRLRANGSYSREGRLGRPPLEYITTSAAVAYRF